MKKDFEPIILYYIYMNPIFATLFRNPNKDGRRISLLNLHTIKNVIISSIISKLLSI